MLQAYCVSGDLFGGSVGVGQCFSGVGNPVKMKHHSRAKVRVRRRHHQSLPVSMLLLTLLLAPNDTRACAVYLGPFLSNTNRAFLEFSKTSGPSESREAATLRDGTLYTDHCFVNEKYLDCEFTLTTHDTFREASDSYWIDFLNEKLGKIFFSVQPISLSTVGGLEVRDIAKALYSLRDSSQQPPAEYQFCAYRQGPAADLNYCQNGGYHFSVSKSSLGKIVISLRHRLNIRPAASS